MKLEKHYVDGFKYDLKCEFKWRNIRENNIFSWMIKAIQLSEFVSEANILERALIKSIN